MQDQVNLQGGLQEKRGLIPIVTSTLQAILYKEAYLPGKGL